MCLFECCAQCGGLGTVLGFQSGDLGGECGDDVVVGCGVGRDRLRRRSVLAPVVFDPRTELSILVEEGVGDAGFALDGLECHRLAAFDQAGDGGLGRSGLVFGFAAGCGLEDLDSLLAGIAHESPFR